MNAVFTLQVLALFFLLSPVESWANHQQEDSATCTNDKEVKVVLLEDSKAKIIKDVKLTGIDQSRHTTYNDARSRCDLNKLSNVPNPEQYIQERKKELDGIHNASFEKGEKSICLIYITGFSGSGKTELASKYARDHEKDYYYTRVFKASDRKVLLDSFTSFARHLCHEDLIICYETQERRFGNNDVFENCLIEIVKRCLKEASGRFLWIFDDAKTYEDIEKYIPNEQGIKGAILITTNNKKDFVSYDSYTVDLNGGMTEEESLNLLNETIRNISKTSNISNICSDEEIKKIKIVQGNLPLPLLIAGGLIGRMRSCKKYTESQLSNPKGIQDVTRQFKYRIPEEAIQNNIYLLDKLNLDIIGFLSFVKTPFPIDLVIIYISTNDEYRKFFDLVPIENKSELYKGICDPVDKFKISLGIEKFDLVKRTDELLSFPHESFIEQIQIFLLKRDKGNPGNYRELFDRVTKFLCLKFSGSFWDVSIWPNESGILLDSVERVVNVFMMSTSGSNDNKDMRAYDSEKHEKLQILNDSQLTLWHRLARYHIENNPTRAIELFDKLLKKIAENNSSSEYLEGSINHAVVMHGLAVAYCQAQYMGVGNSSIDLDKAETLAKSAYEIFENKLDKENPRTLNAYLTLAHIRVNLKQGASYGRSQGNMIQFLGSEPTIDAAIELTDLRPELEPEDFNNLRNELSWPSRSSSSRGNYLSIYTKVEEKLGEKF